MTKKILGALLALFLLLAAVLAVNTLRKGSRQLPVEPLAPVAVDEAAAAQRLGAAVRLPTISARDDAQLSADQFQALHALLAQQFPRVHAQLQREVVGGVSLLYTWKGTDPQAKPVALLAHQDVVPIAPGTEGDWAVPPFSGAVKDGHIWGRGAWDDKGNLLSQLEAVEMLLAQGYQPPRTLYLAYGADEEVGGQRGAAQIAALLQSRGVQLDFVLDEGLLVLDGVMPGLARPAALIGVAEKGYMSVVLRLSATPGHSSMPPPKGTSAIAMLSAALKRLEDEQLPGGIRGVAAEMFDTLAPEMGGFSRVALSNLWLFGPLVQKQLEGAASTNALLRTTTALTIVQAGNKEEALRAVAESVKGEGHNTLEQVFGLLVAREALAPTGVGEGLAIPQLVYPNALELNRPRISLIFLEEPVDYDSLDGQSVSVLLGLLCSGSRAYHILLNRLYYALRDRQFVDCLREQGGRSQLMAQLIRIESGLRQSDPDFSG